VRVTYIIIDFFLVLIGMLLIYYVAPYIDEFSWILSCPNGSNFEECLGIASVYRLSFALVFMHCFVLLMLCCRNDCSKSFNEGAWGFKIMLVVSIFIGSFWIDNNIFIGYGAISMIISIAFLVV